MVCGGCLRGVTAIIQDLDSEAAVSADLSNKTINVKSTLNAEKILQALKAGDFPSTPA